MMEQLAALSSAVSVLQEQLATGQQAQRVLQGEVLRSKDALIRMQQQYDEQRCLLEQQSTGHGSGHLSYAPKLPKPAVFTGQRRGPTPQNWCHSMETYLVASGIDLTTASSVRLAAGYLADSALTWYRLHLAEVDRGVCAPYQAWLCFKEALLKRFVPIPPDTLARGRLYTLKQHQSVQAYAAEYNDCMLQIVDMSEKDRIDRFLRGLKSDIRVLVELQRPASLVDAIELATQIDSIVWQARRAPYRSSTSAIAARNSGVVSSGLVPMELGAAESSVHGRRFSVVPNTVVAQSKTIPARVPPGRAGMQPVGGRRPMQCFYCKQMGHVQRYCKKRARDVAGFGLIPRNSKQ